MKEQVVPEAMFAPHGRYFRLATACAVAAVSLLWAARDVRAAEPARNNYYYSENWLCRPDRNEACKGNLTATVIEADGKLARQRFHSDPAAPIDCFYVYPTVSRELTPLSDMRETPEERAVVRQQFAPFGAKCRLFAPLYRQITLATLEAEAHGTVPDFDPETPARDVVDAWKAYVARDNAGRGFVLIGHSQGAAILKNIVAALIDGTPLARQLVSVIIPGTNVDVPPGGDVGGTFAGIPLCRSADQTACVIVYSSFLASDPPDSSANFGMSSRPGMRDGCVNPALLATGTTGLDAVLPALADIKAKFATSFFETPRLLSGACATNTNHTYLAISVGRDRRAPGVLRLLQTVVHSNPGWGLHEMDINLAMGDLIAIVGAESKAWLAHHRPGSR